MMLLHVNVISPSRVTSFLSSSDQISHTGTFCFLLRNWSVLRKQGSFFNHVFVNFQFISCQLHGSIQLSPLRKGNIPKLPAAESKRQKKKAPKAEMIMEMPNAAAAEAE